MQLGKILNTEHKVVKHSRTVKVAIVHERGILLSTMAVNFEVAFSKITDTQSTWDVEVTICKTCILTKSCQN